MFRDAAQVIAVQLCSLGNCGALCSAGLALRMLLVQERQNHRIITSHNNVCSPSLESASSCFALLM
jgi:hypothetical protein